MPSTTTIFNLPESLAAKIAPGLIGPDEQHFATLTTSLEHQIQDLNARLDHQRQLPGTSGQQALERDLETHRLSARLRVLRRYGVDLCLGRMVPEDATEPVYIGRVGLTGTDGDRLLLDWRSAAAEPFFAATHAEPMKLTSRRRYRWHDGRIVDYWDEVFDTGALAGHAALDEQSAFIASLGASRSGRMHDVLGTIAADQDAIIRAGSNGPLVVEGGPGTGKTVVALHRAAYLLYSDPQVDDRRGGVLVVGPHEPYLGYVADVLPDLGEDGVQTCTVEDLVPETPGAGEEGDPEVAVLKASVGLVGAIEAAVGFYEQPPTGTTIVETRWGQVPLRGQQWAEAFGAVDPGTPHNEAREQIWQTLAGIICDQVAEHTDEQVEQDQVRIDIQRDDELTQGLIRAWPLLTAEDIVGDLWSVPAYLRMCAPHLSPDQIRSLQRRDPDAWTRSDLPILDAARHRLGDPGAEQRRRRHDAAVVAEQRARSDVAADLIAAGNDDLHVMSMLRGEDLREALVDSRPPRAEARVPFAGPFAHVIVDEAQELNDAQWQMLLRRCPSGSLTIVGDRAQARRGFTESWADRLERVGLGNTRLATLSLNYRTPDEVMTYAEPVIRAVLPDANVPTSVRHDGLPVRHGSRSQLESILTEWLAENDGVACVVGDPTVGERARVRVLTPELTKGLEFDLVILIDADHVGTGIEGAVDRYVAMTRATQQLVVLAGE